MTQNPMFCVQEKRRTYGMESDERVWFDWEEGHECNPPEDPENPPEGVEHIGFHDQWFTVMTALTEAACKQYLRANKHNHGETQIYVESFNRNHEMVALREWLLTLHQPTE